MRVLRAIERHWFEPAPLSDLAIVRILVVGSQLLIFLPELQDQLWIAAADASLFRPIPALKVLMLPFGEWGVRPEPMFLHAVWSAAVVTGITGVLGLYTRGSLAVFAAANTLLVAHRYSYTEYHHKEALMIMALWVLALAPSGAAYSLDDLRGRLLSAARSMHFRSRTRRVLSEMARWPLRTIQWLFVLAYLSAGVSKLRVGGLEWFNGHTLSYYLMRDGLRWGSDLGIWMSEHVALLAVLSVGTVLFEMTFALAVLVPVLAWPYLLGGAVLHTGIYVLQRAPFFQYLFLYVVFIEPLRRHVPEALRTAEPTRWTVIFDGFCPRCVRTMVVLDYLDVGGRLRYVDAERDGGKLARLHPDLTVEDARHAMHVIGPDGTVHRGYHSFHALARALPALWPLLPLFHLPTAGRMGPRLYEKWAARRNRTQCTPDVCGPQAYESRALGATRV